MATQEQTDALKLIGDLSKWVAAVETGVIAAIGAIVRSSVPTNDGRYYFTMSLIAMTISIFAAGGVLISLPAAIQDIDEKDKVWNRPATLGPITHWPLRNVLGAQLLSFVVGIIAFGLGTIALMFDWKLMPS